MKHPPYDSYKEDQDSETFGIKVAQSFSELMQSMSIRAAVFVGEQYCPYEEEFDGNDFSSTHLIGYKGNEPIACVRLRFFADFAKLERLAVRPEFRDSKISRAIVRAAIQLIRKKGYSVIYGHAQTRLVNFWSRFGFQVVDDKPEFKFSDFAYREIVLNISPDPQAISLDDDPYTIIRPEGSWHCAGVLENSADRPVTNPIRNLKAA